MIFLAILFHFLSSVSFSIASTSSKTVLVGASAEISCFSSFPPIWLWFGPKQLRPKSLASDGTKPHPTLNDERFNFFKKGSSDEYVIKIVDLKSEDAGKFVCDGNNYYQIDLNVLR